jgi:tetratricopeptide (TPR) repeat protein
VIAGGAWWLLNASQPASVATKTPAEAARLMRCGLALAIRPFIFGGPFNGSVKVFLAKHEEAVGELRRAIEANRNFAAAHFYRGVALAELGRFDEARLEAREGLSIDPPISG